MKDFLFFVVFKMFCFHETFSKYTCSFPSKSIHRDCKSMRYDSCFLNTRFPLDFFIFNLQVDTK